MIARLEHFVMFYELVIYVSVDLSRHFPCAPFIVRQYFSFVSDFILFFPLASYTSSDIADVVQTLL